MIQYARNNWNIFAIIGALEALTFLLALYSAARLPGSLISVIGQGGILWSVLFARLLLKKSFDKLQLLGVFVVLIGVLTCTVPQLPAGALVTQQHRIELWAYSGLYLLSSAFSAISFTLKEKCLKEGELDIIIVSCFGSLAQCIFTFLLLPLTLAIATSLPPQVYFQKGLAAFSGATHSCMPWLFFAYMIANLSLNLSGIALTKRGGAVGTFVIGTVLVPITSLVFCLNIPLLGASRFSWIFVGGLVFTTAGSLLYNHQKVSGILRKGSGIQQE
ncbi:hypothetical protein GUITHDRAFT_132977 [Guillardia theta CCMP2712]|uniref:EamA domain-containing protein n=1 Tax=Guillardia theta (strain CCMP2712) TaxID=905079 RepID=L1JY15_GUITC|nr:hypothetical protein GUITHDRAFT_132977 [Guillardia theta CCMP2712]EKX53224.1 hypothetical protein GUITHDRAFT_132977 [Guillardia theta CCMP2712]|eukprot:XP_005840204.1 hypothetical protein GUITHDRAFT_132977 [Guillardia theta CCMP2712]